MSAKIYTSKEAVELLKQGKSIAGECWQANEYIYGVTGTKEVVTSHGASYCSNIDWFDGYYPNAMWVEHKGGIKSKQIYSTSQAYDLLKQGKKIRGVNWSPDNDYYCIKGNQVVNSNDCIWEG